MDANEAARGAAVLAFKTFLIESFEHDDEFETRVRSTHENLLRGKEPTVRLLLPLDALRNSSPREAEMLLKEPLVGLRAAETALEEVVAEKRWLHDGKVVVPTLEPGKNVADNLRIGVVGNFGSHFVSPRTLKANFVGKMVCVEGIVTKISSVQPKLVKSVHYCPTTKMQLRRDYRDGTSLSGPPTSTILPQKDMNGALLELEFGLSVFKNYQRITVQEMPERAPLGQLPRSVDVIVEDDLVDRVKPGDRIHATGVYRALTGVQVPKTLSGFFKVVLVCNAIQTVGRDVGGLTMTLDDVTNILELAKEADVFKKLVRSLAPSIYGHERIKEALLLVLFGGMERNLANGTHLRGDINVLLVGDPSTAKSQLLRFMLGIAPLAISTTGRGSTGVGLTAAVTRDPESGESRLEAGAMVLADRGIVLIDEFDKMGDGDRVALHEVMEQQTVTIAKAGIHAQLNARCSVVAAANPVYGSYDKDLSPQRNVGLPDSLLSRFDCLFIVLDNASAEHDRRIADHVLRMHRYQRPGHEGKPLPLHEDALIGHLLSRVDDDGDDGAHTDETSPVWQKHNPLLHANYSGGRGEKLLHTEFIRKYVNYAKMRVKPTLTTEASSIIVGDYVELRQEQANKTLPITPRCLETLIRLATAHAKARLSPLVEAEDCVAARAILRFALYNDTGDAPVERRKRSEDDGGSAGEDDDGDNGEGARKRPRQKKTQGRKRRGEKKPAKKARAVDRDESSSASSSSSSDEAESDGHDDDDAHDEEELSKVDRFNLFTAAVSKAFVDTRQEELTLAVIMDAANAFLKTLGKRAKPFGKDEVEAALRVLDETNKIMYRDEVIYQVA